MKITGAATVGLDPVRTTTVIDRSRGMEIQKDAEGNVIRTYEGIDMKAVYRDKPLLYKAVKRLFDIVVSGLGLIILSPLFLALAIAIKREDGGPVFFSGKRWGKDFQYFPMHNVFEEVFQSALCNKATNIAV